MKVTINRDSDAPVYVQIIEQVRRQILSGELLPGFRLPAERKLAENLGVNRTTVLNAYSELKAEGLIGSRVGAGTIVLSYLDEELSGCGSSREPQWNQIFSQYSNRFDSCLVQDLLMLASRNDVISFATGIASPESGPIEALEGIENEVVNNRNFRSLLHTPTEGFISLRKVVCGLMQKRGLYCRPDEIMILSGSQQGIDLAARILIDPGDIVVVEEPTYFPAIQVFRTAGARVIGVPIDDKGMNVDVLEQLLHRYRPKLIYTIPTFQNPSGAEMELERRKRLVRLASKHNVMILEDDAYGDLCYEGNLLPMLKSLDNEGYVIYLSTFSKNIYSGLRLGWMVAHKKIIREFASAKQLIDLHSSSLSQYIVERFIENGSLEAHLNKVCSEYRTRRDIMYKALAKYAPKDLIWNRPKGGYYFWCRLPDGISSLKLLAKAADYKVSFVPGSPFFSSGQGDNFIRLNFTYAPLKDIEEGIKRLCAAMKELEAEKGNDDLYSILEINPIV
ncbi:PLP-dependent aminotransferase family protein [Desulfosporosinus youngiae]|uniref:Transcriptional regulator with HTH domain and aminotransferase domain n=1 Tax=Desulfosporosinus youngiae DSM 17734 TaxID=768710 RepID=H5XVP0_9FIRM|nr:PLP-dependent aminotransferase family protein [Desulfosporosinus youngiae]EHQ90123.1 transcriptional regulator with HTH domain and aminotransferase domain [Desulfosporosinus youngiae DSM 17734]